MRSITLRVILCLVGILSCMACSSCDSASPEEASLEGAWGLQSLDDESGIRVYSKLESLSGNQNGYMFEQGGSLMVRDSGWCGTPPLSFSNYPGSWEEQQENLLLLTYPQLDEMANYSLRILHLDRNELRCRIEFVDSSE